MLSLRKMAPEQIGVKLKDASFPTPFPVGLEYATPARGHWNIVHIGMLVPEAHEIFVCADSCLRGVILTATEGDFADRFHTIAIRENNVLEGDTEQLIIDGVDDILAKIDERPKAIELYTSCIHYFIGCDINYVFAKLRANHPDIDFIDCYMNPIMRFTKLPPDPTMRKQMFGLLKQKPLNNKHINIIGNDFRTNTDSEFLDIMRSNGYEVKEIQDCKTYEEFQNMGDAFMNITCYPTARFAGEELEERFGAKHLHLPQSFTMDEIDEQYALLCKELGIPSYDTKALREEVEIRLKTLKEIIGDVNVVIDYSLTPRPFSLARLLLEHGIHVTTIYTEGIVGEDQKDFAYCQQHYGEVLIMPTENPCMRSLERVSTEKILALGQNAAYFNSTPYFVNMVEGGGLFGYKGILKMCDLIEDAYKNEKDTRKLISVKGWRCNAR